MLLSIKFFGLIFSFLSPWSLKKKLKRLNELIENKNNLFILFNSSKLIRIDNVL
jgi:hypothetical protein